jgi:hypothetical protein
MEEEGGKTIAFAITEDGDIIGYYDGRRRCFLASPVASVVGERITSAMLFSWYQL